jgi:uncharacterized glyoxalase superfamily protein PhnB
MTTTAPPIRDLKVFVPAQDFAVSRRFYLALGGTLNWEAEGLAEIALGGARVLLQDFYVKEWAENFMMSLRVDDAAAWRAHMDALIASGRFPGVRVRGPVEEPWGATITYAWDPCGVLLHFSQPTHGA